MNDSTIDLTPTLSLRERARRWVDNPCVQSLIIALIIVNAMQTYSDEERTASTQAADNTRAHIEMEMHAEIRAMRDDMRGLRGEIARLRSG